MSFEYLVGATEEYDPSTQATLTTYDFAFNLDPLNLNSPCYNKAKFQELWEKRDSEEEGWDWNAKNLQPKSLLSKI